MKKLFLSIAVLAMTCVAFSSCDDDECTCTYTDYNSGETETETIKLDDLKKEGYNFSNCSELNDADEDGMVKCK